TVVEELNAVRAALLLCFAISNRYIMLKGQHVRPMRNRYEQVRQEHDEFLERARTHRGPPPLAHDFHADLQTITPVLAPIQVLERYVFEKISIQGRALAAAVDLVGAIDGLEKAIAYRNDLIAQIHKESPVRPDLLAEQYFGLRNANGVIDERFK